MDEELGKIGPVPSGCCENPWGPLSGRIFTSSATRRGSVNRPWYQ
jgi:hypothetical protein